MTLPFNYEVLAAAYACENSVSRERARYEVLLSKGVNRLYGDGIHDDTEAYQAAMDGEPYVYRGAYRQGLVHNFTGGRFRFTKTIHMNKNDVNIDGGCYEYSGRCCFSLHGIHNCSFSNFEIRTAKFPLTFPASPTSVDSAG